MKAICIVCEQAFKVCQVIFDKDSGIVGEGFQLIPTHDAVEGKKETAIVQVPSGKVIRRICAGSLKPPLISVH